MSKIKLLKIFPSTMRGGVEEYALTMACAAIGKGWEVHVAFPDRGSTSTLQRDFLQIGAFYHPLEIPPEAIGIRQFIVKVVRTLVLLLRLRPDAVQLSLPFPDQCLASMAACALLKIPTVVVFHLVSEGLSLGQRQLALCRWARERNQQWISISENNRELLSKLFNVSKKDFALVYNGPYFSCDNNQKFNKAIASKEVRHELGFYDSDIIILTVGRLHPQKGYVHMIPAIPHILKKYPNSKFVWVGEGEQRRELESLLKDYHVESSVTFLGYRADVPRLLMASDIFVFPTLYEGCPLVLFEAMEFGLPVVSSNASGIPEVIIDNMHGILFRKADSCSLLVALSWALDNHEKMQQMAVNACLRVKDFSREKMTEKTLGIIESMAALKQHDSVES